MLNYTVESEEVFSKYPIIQRESFAKHLTQFLNTKAEDGYVLNLNAEWGAGKTTFLKCWYNMLKEDHPVVYFDAWKSDFTHDAMLALLDAFQSQLVSPLSENEAFLKKYAQKGKRILLSALPSLAVGYLKHKTGVPQDESLISDAASEYGIDEKLLGDAAKEALKAMLEQRSKVDGIKEFKEQLVKISQQYFEVYQNKSKPVYILIDELDRCRPSYAIEVIECVKHFFDTKDFVFILSTDTDQLQHSIKAVYGEGFESNSYLSRFFDRVVTLPKPSLQKYVEASISNLVTSNPDNRNAPCLINLIVNIFEIHKINSLREINKILSDIEVASSNTLSFEILPILILSILNRNYKVYYEEFKNKGTNPYSLTKYISTERKEKNLILPNYDKHFNLTNDLKVNVRDMLHYLIVLGGYESTFDYNDYYYNSASTENRLNSVIRQYSLLFTTNPSVEKYNTTTERINYCNIIEMAGHFS